MLARVRVALPYVAAALAAIHYIRGIAAYMATVRPEIVDFDVYFRAAQAVATGQPVYHPFSGCCFDERAMDGYTYPPVLAVVLSPLTALPVGVVGRLFLGLSQLCLLAAIVVIHRTLRDLLPLRTQTWLLAAVLLFQPIHAGNFGIQLDNPLLLLFAVAAWAYVRGRGGALGGAAIGLGAALKIAPAEMLPALLNDRPRRALASALGLCAGAAVPLLSVWPVARTLTSYFTGVLPSFAGGVSSPYNRSLAGVVLRTFSATGGTPPPSLAMLFHAAQVGGVVLTWFVCRRSASTVIGRAATFAAFLAVMPITQPVTWDHHQASDALAFALIAPSLRAGARSWWAAVCGMALMSVNQLVLAGMVQTAGLDHPHGAAIALFVGAASVNLVGMMLLYGASLHAAWDARVGDGSGRRAESSMAEADEHGAHNALRRLPPIRLGDYLRTARVASEPARVQAARSPTPTASGRGHLADRGGRDEHRGLRTPVRVRRCGARRPQGDRVAPFRSSRRRR